MIKRLRNLLLDARARQRINIALAKGTVGLQNRQLAEDDPQSWEFSAFSQNGEDGILHFLRSRLLRRNRYFVEIGAADGIQNNTAWLAIAEQYGGMMIEGDANLSERSSRVVSDLNIGLTCVNLFVTRESAAVIKGRMILNDPDVFSLDIDGNDYYIAQALLEVGIRPKIWVVEYNSVFGPTRALTVEYRKDFTIKCHPSELYYGVSIAGWRRLFDSAGYRFVTVDRHGVNAFFVDPSMFDSRFLCNLRGTMFAENIYQSSKFSASSELQFKLIEREQFVSIEG
jgi:hypothetical protein